MMNNFKEIKKNFPVIIDTCIFMVGIDKRQINPDYSLEKMKTLWLNDVLSYFDKIYLHEIVYKELDDETRVIIDGYTDKNIEIVSDKDWTDTIKVQCLNCRK